MAEAFKSRPTSGSNAVLPIKAPRLFCNFYIKLSIIYGCSGRKQSVGIHINTKIFYLFKGYNAQRNSKIVLSIHSRQLNNTEQLKN